MTKHGPAELNHREGTKATPGMTEVYFGPDDGCPVAHVQGPDRGEIGARIVACVNACEGIEDPEAFVKAAIKIHGFAASHTGNGCQTDTESRWAYRGGESPGALAMWVDQLRAALGGER